MNNKEIELRISDLIAMILKAAKPILCLVLVSLPSPRRTWIRRRRRWNPLRRPLPMQKRP